MGKKEGVVEDHLVDRCTMLGWICLKYTSQTNTGWPDRIVIGNGHVVFVELKAKGQRLRRLQQVRAEQLRAQGAEVHTIDNRRDVDLLVIDLSRR